MRKSLFLATLLLFLACQNSFARPGCGGTKGVMAEACSAAKSRGVKIISCYRSPAEQESLRRRLYAQGRRGQVARGRSRHSLGMACDFGSNLGSRYRSVKRLNSRGHSGNHYSDNGH